jgi:hypothetical protein
LTQIAKTAVIVVLAALPLVAAAEDAPKLPDAARLAAMSARFASVPLAADLKTLPDNERKALAKMVEAARLMDPIFLRQSWAGNEALLLALAPAETPLRRAQRHEFLLNRGPWSRLDENAPFLVGVPPVKPAYGNFYPQDATKEEVERWWNALPEADKARAKGFFTTIRRDEKGGLTIVPYSVEYQGELAEAARLLREAAELTTQPTLKSFLSKRADAFLSNDYYASDVAWMELDASIEPTIGPYEVYEDEWFNAKAAYEAFIAVRDAGETDKLQRLGSHLQELEDHLPIDPEIRNPKLGALAPIRVVNLVFASGDANRGVQTAAYNLPNDERVVQEKGSKRVMLRNTQQAKFAKVLMPIAGVALPLGARKDVSFDAFFTHILMHELMHGLGPHNITVGGKATTVRAELKDAYSTLEEAKADISGLWALQYLVNKGVLDKSLSQSMYTTFLASTFRSIRFGLTEAHGRGIAIQLDFLLDTGAFKVAPDGTFTVVGDKIQEAVAGLTRDIMMIQARGDYAAAKKMIEGAVVRPEVKRVLDRLKTVPVDIEPHFVTADEITGRATPPRASPPKH